MVTAIEQNGNCGGRTETRNDCLIIFLSGEITNKCEQCIISAYAELEEKTLTAMIVDFSNVSYINSAGIAVLITLLTKMKAKNQRLLLTNLSDYFLKIFTTIGLTRYSRYFPTLEEALKHERGESHCVN